MNKMKVNIDESPKQRFYDDFKKKNFNNQNLILNFAIYTVSVKNTTKKPMSNH